MQYNFNEPQRQPTQQTQQVYRPAPRVRRPRRSYTRVMLSIVIGSICAAVVFFLTHLSLNLAILWAALLAYLFFTFSASLVFRDSVVNRMISYALTKRIIWPGLIWEFSREGCLWFIGVKLFFIFCGLIASVLRIIFIAFIGAIIVSSVAYYIDLIRYIRAVNTYRN